MHLNLSVSEFLRGANPDRVGVDPVGPGSERQEKRLNSLFAFDIEVKNVDYSIIAMVKAYICRINLFRVE